MNRVLFLLVCFYSQCVYAQMNEGNLVTKNRYYEIPLTETKKEIRASAVMKGESCDFMLDTGAPTFISSEIQKKYKFPYIMHTHTGDAGGKTLKTDIVRIDTLQVGPFVFTGVPAIVLDLENSPLQCYHLAGNVGSNVLRHLIAQFDIAEHRVAMTDKKSLLKTPLKSPMPMQINQQSDVYFPVRLNNGLPDTVHFDSGDGQLFNMSKSMAEKFKAAYPSDIVRQGYGTISMGIGGIGASFPQYVMKPSSIKIDADTISGGAIYIAGNDRSRMGRELLNHGVLTLDYQDSLVSFEKYPEHYTGNNYDYGFKPILDEETVLVGCVWQNTIAEHGGMQSGDKILKINAVDFSTLPKCDVEIALKRELLQNSSTINVTYKHKKNKPKTITLEKRSI